MGRYHQFYNLTKKETVSHYLFDGDDLSKMGDGGAYMVCLVHLLCNSNRGDIYVGEGWPWSEKMGTKEEKKALINVVVGRWAGDRIVIQNDNAKEDDPGYISREELEEYREIGHHVARTMDVSNFTPY